MTTVKSLRFWTKPLIVFAVLQFVFYMFCFWILYRIDSITVSGHDNGQMWRIALIFAILGAIFTSAGPALARDCSDSIRLGEERNYLYYTVFLTLIIYALYILGRSYYFWSFSIDINDIYYMSVFYVFFGPIITFAGISLQKDRV